MLFTASGAFFLPRRWARASWKGQKKKIRCFDDTKQRNYVKQRLFVSLSGLPYSFTIRRVAIPLLPS